MATVPTCVAGNAAGVAIQDYMTVLHARCAAAPGDFAVANVVGSPVTSFTLTHTLGFQINFRVSGGAILSVIAPAGGIANSAAPGTPTNAYTEDTFIPSPSGTSTRYQFAQYGDAILFAINGSANTFSIYASHTGKIRVVNDGADATGGLGLLAYIPNPVTGTTAFNWFCTNATGSNRKSHIRVAAGTWADPVIPISIGNYTTQIAARLGDLPVAVPDSGAPAASTSPVRGVFRYLRIDTTTTAGAALSVLPDGGSNQGWLRLADTATTTRLVALWNDTVTP
jgi:hypothetical protein